MGKDSFRFTADGDTVRPACALAPPTSVDTLLNDNRRVDDALLHALSLVLSSNSEYARSVSALLENDLSREQTIGQLTGSSKELLENTRKLIASQEQLKDLLEGMNEDYKQFLEEAIGNHLGIQKVYMDQKFKALFENAGLKEDGSNYGPTDKLVLKTKAIFTQEVWVMAVGALIYWLGTLAFQHFRGPK